MRGLFTSPIYILYYNLRNGMLFLLISITIVYTFEMCIFFCITNEKKIVHYNSRIAIRFYFYIVI